MKLHIQTRHQVLLILAAIACVVAYTLTGVPEDRGAIVYSHGPVLDLGRTVGGAHDVQFELRNVGNKRIALRRCYGSCKCTAITCELGSLDPGHARTCRVKLTVEPNVRDTAYVFFEYDDGRLDSVAISFWGTNVGELVLHPESFASSALPGTRCEGELRVTLTGVSPDLFLPARWEFTPPHKIHLLSAHESLQGDERMFTVRFRTTPLGVNEKIRGFAECKIGAPAAARSKIPITVTAGSELVLRPRSLSTVIPNDVTFPVVVGNVLCTVQRGWKITAIRPPSWMNVQRDAASGEVKLVLVERPPWTLGVGNVIVCASSEAGQTASATIRVAVQSGERAE